MRIRQSILALSASIIFSRTATADTNPWSLNLSSFAQNWTDIALITVNDSWSGVPSITGYLGDDAATTATPRDPQLTLAGTLSGTIDVIANQTSPNTLTNGGVAEFHITDPTIALQGSGTSDSPNIVIFLNATGVQDVTVSYLLRDIDGAADNSIQPVGLQYRVGGIGDFFNVPAGFVADASTGPSLADATFNVSATLPSDANNAALVEVRIMGGNAASNDEWIGVDNISVTAVPEPGSIALLLGGLALVAGRRRRA